MDINIESIIIIKLHIMVKARMGALLSLYDIPNKLEVFSPIKLDV